MTCPTCQLEPIYEGFEHCLKCEVAGALVEDPDYINFARRVYAGTEWLAGVEREWQRQASALSITCGHVGPLAGAA